MNSNIKIVKLSAATASGIGQVDSGILDMSDFEGAVLFTAIGTADPTNYLKASEGQQPNLSDTADLIGSKVIAAANGQVVGIEIFQPSERYIRASVVRGVATTVGEIYALQYGGRIKPPLNQILNIINVVTLIAPDEGAV